MVATKGAVIITGCSTGIGRATALYLDQMGFSVFAGVRRAEDAEALRRDASPALTPVILDVSDDESIRSAHRLVAEAVGESGLAGLVNNAGTSHPGPLECVPPDRIRQMVNVMLVGPMMMIQTFLPMIRASKGRIINVGSIGGIAPMPFFGTYSAAKGGIHALTTGLRRELAPFGIEVILVVPGNIRTPIWTRGQDNLRQIAEQISEPYRESFAVSMASLDKMGPAGIPPEEVAKAIEKALTDNRPRTRYTVGSDAVKQGWAAKWLPDRFLDRNLHRLL